MVLILDGDGAIYFFLISERHITGHRATQIIFFFQKKKLFSFMHAQLGMSYQLLLLP